MPQHTKDKLADALRQAGLGDMAIKAQQGYYHNFLSPLTLPSLQLRSDLSKVGTDQAAALIARHMQGEFNASKAESDEWAETDQAKAIFAKLSPDMRKIFTGRKSDPS